MPKLHPFQNPICVIGETDPFLTQLMQRFAEKSGLKIRLARTGPEVFSLAERGPTIIIIDPELPGKLRGWEVIRTLRAHPQLRRLPLIVFSWLTKDEALMLSGPVSAYLQKPDLSYEDFTGALKAAGVKSRS